MTKNQKALPGMEERSIKELDELCHEYAGMRDKRMDLTKREVELQADLLTCMRKHKKRVYEYEEIHAEIVTEKTKVKVKIKKEEAEEEDAEDAAA